MTTLISFYNSRYPLEMHMIHFEDSYVASNGRIKFGQAYASPLGVAILSVFFKVDHTKPQVLFC